MTRKWMLLAGVVLLAGALSQIAWRFDLISEQYPHCYDPDPRLPNVLLIGDSTQIRYYAGVKQALQGRANVYRLVEWAPQRPHSLLIGGPLLQPVNAASTVTGLAKLEQWLGEVRWDVIHFNWGLHDLHRGDGQQTAASQPGTGVLRYTENLRALSHRLHATSAVLILATTTPVPATLGYRPGEVEAFNDAARKLAATNQLLLNDLYAITQPRQAELQYAQDIHYNDGGTAVLATATADSILRALGQR